MNMGYYYVATQSAIGNYPDPDHGLVEYGIEYCREAYNAWLDTMLAVRGDYG